MFTTTEGKKCDTSRPVDIIAMSCFKPSNFVRVLESRNFSFNARVSSAICCVCSRICRFVFSRKIEREQERDEFGLVSGGQRRQRRQRSRNIIKREKTRDNWRRRGRRENSINNNNYSKVCGVLIKKKEHNIPARRRRTCCSRTRRRWPWFLFLLCVCVMCVSAREKTVREFTSQKRTGFKI